MKYLLINKYDWNIPYLDAFTTDSIELADWYFFNQFLFHNVEIKYKTIFVSKEWDVFCFNIWLISKKYHSYFLIWKISDTEISSKINYFFNNLWWIFLHTLSILSDLVSINIVKYNNIINIKDFFWLKVNNISEVLLIKKDVLVPDNLVVNKKLYSLYELLNKKLWLLTEQWLIWNIFFEDFILSLLPEKYWVNSVFYLKSNLKFKISNFFNTYNDVISLHIPVARSKYLNDLLSSLLSQTSNNFNINIGVDWYNKKQKENIIKIIKKFENEFKSFNYFVNRKNLWVWKTRWKLLNFDKKSRYIVFLDDDNFLSSNAIEKLYFDINRFSKCGMYSIPNIDVRYDIDYRDYINNNWPFNQPIVYTNRERINRLPLYCDQEETPLIHDRYYSDLLDIKYNKTFDNCSIDMVFNRFLEIICWNTNFEWLYQFMRVGHQFHQTRTKWFDEKEFKYVMYILKTISYLNNNNIFYTYLIKTQVPKQNELFINE